MSLNANFSPSIYQSVVALITHLDNFLSRSKSLILDDPKSLYVMPNQLWASGFGFSMSVSLELLSFNFDLANDGENSAKLVLDIQGLDIRYVVCCSV